MASPVGRSREASPVRTPESQEERVTRSRGSEKPSTPKENWTEWYDRVHKGKGGQRARAFGNGALAVMKWGWLPLLIGTAIGIGYCFDAGMSSHNGMMNRFWERIGDGFNDNHDRDYLITIVVLTAAAYGFSLAALFVKRKNDALEKARLDKATVADEFRGEPLFTDAGTGGREPARDEPVLRASRRGDYGSVASPGAAVAVPAAPKAESPKKPREADKAKGDRGDKGRTKERTEPTERTGRSGSGRSSGRSHGSSRSRRRPDATATVVD